METSKSLGIQAIEGEEEMDYIQRDEAAADFTKADLTLDGNKHDLDLSGILPEGAKNLPLEVALFTDDNAGEEIIFYNGGTDNQEGFRVKNTEFPLICRMVSDENRHIQYWTEDTFVGDTIIIWIRGYWVKL